MTAPKQAEAFAFGMEKVPALTVVAWLTSWTKDRIRPAGSIVNRSEPQQKFDCNRYDPLVRLTDAQSALLAQAAEKDAEIERLRADAERYRWLRQYPNNLNGLVYGPTHGALCGGLLRRDDYLDTAIDASRALAKQEAKS
jgi:hypothetical protein